MIILHGDNIQASRQALLAARHQAEANHLPVTELAGEKISLSDLIQSISSMSILGPSNFIIIYDFFSRRPGREKAAILEYIKAHPDLDIVFWEGKDISTSLTGFSSSLIRKHDLPKYLFSYLDHPSPHLLHQALQSASPEQLLALLAKRFHDLILAKSGNLGSSDWKTRNLVRQASAYSMEKLIYLHELLLKLDISNKTSSSPFSLTSALEIWTLQAL